MQLSEPAENDPRTLSNAYSWYATVILTAAFTLSFIDRQILAVMIEPIKKDLGISDTQVSLLLGAAFVFSYTLLTPVAGWLSDRFSRTKIAAAGVLVWSVMTAFSGIAQNYSQLFYARAGVGLGEATIGPAGYSILTDYFSRDRLPAAMALFAASPFIGVGIAFMFGGWLTEYLLQVPSYDLPIVGTVFSWQITFLIVGLPGVLLAFVVYRLRDPVRSGMAGDGQGNGEGNGPDDGQAGQIAPPLPMSEIFRFLGARWRYFSLHFVAYLGLSIQGYALFAWVISFFVRFHEMPRSQIGLIYGAIALVMGIAGSLWAGFYAGRMIRRGTVDATLRLVIVSSVGLAPLFVVMSLVPQAWIAIVLLIPITFFMAMPPGLGNTALQVIAPNQLRGQVMASYLLVTNFLAYLLAPLIVALLTERVFQDEKAIGSSLAVMAVVTYPTAAICLSFALKYFREALAKADEWDAQAA